MYGRCDTAIFFGAGRVFFSVDISYHTIHRRFIYKGDASTHAQGTDPRVALGATPQKLSAEPRNSASAEALAVSGEALAVARGPKEASRECFFGALGQHVPPSRMGRAAASAG